MPVAARRLPSRWSLQSALSVPVVAYLLGHSQLPEGLESRSDSYRHLRLRLLFASSQKALEPEPWRVRYGSLWMEWLAPTQINYAQVEVVVGDATCCYVTTTTCTHLPFEPESVRARELIFTGESSPSFPQPTVGLSRCRAIRCTETAQSALCAASVRFQCGVRSDADMKTKDMRRALFRHRPRPRVNNRADSTRGR